MTDKSNSPAARARPWAYWTLAIIAISNISVISSIGIFEYLARTLIVGGFVTGLVYLIAFGVLSFRAKRGPAQL
jgi:hypothetical protein